MNDFWAGVIILIVIFLLCRELMCWYWKQNEQVRLLKDIKVLLEEHAAAAAATGSVSTGRKKSGKQIPPASSQSCKYCGADNLVSNTNCISCGNKISP
jgi:hypothetical protein